MVRPVLALLTHAHLVACVSSGNRELPLLALAEAGGIETGVEEVLEKRVVELVGEPTNLDLVHESLQHEIGGCAELVAGMDGVEISCEPGELRRQC